MFTEWLFRMITTSRFISRCPVKFARCFSSENSDPADINPKKIVSKQLKEALERATDSIHPNNKEEKSKLTGVALKKLSEIEFDAFQNATSPQTADLMTDSLLANLQSLQVQRPQIPSYSKDLREASQIRVALRREIFHEAIKKGLSAEKAKISAEKILPVVEQVMTNRRHEKLSSVAAEIEKFDKEDDKLTILDKEILDKIIKKRDNIFYREEELMASVSTEAKPTIQPDKDAPSIFNDSAVKLNIFNNEFKPNNLEFWKKWDDDKARITNLSMGPKNAIEEQILWTEQGKMWPYPINNEYLLGDEENVKFMDHIFLQNYLKQYDLPEKGPVAHFMELVCVGLSKNPYMTISKKREHLDAFALYFNPDYVKKVEQLHEQEQIAAANS